MASKAQKRARSSNSAASSADHAKSKSGEEKALARMSDEEEPALKRGDTHCLFSWRDREPFRRVDRVFAFARSESRSAI